MVAIMVLFIRLFFWFPKSGILYNVKPHAFVKSCIVSVCPHGITTGYCALCFCTPYFKLQSIANCTHDFVRFSVHNNNLGILCDFDGGTHIAVTSIASVVHTCPTCNAIVCSACYVG